MKLVFKADSVIQRDALRARLAATGIATVSPERDLFERRVTGTTTDLGLDGYSTTFDGFGIYVNDGDETAARGVIDEFAREIQTTMRAEETPTSHWRRFYYSSLFSILLPGVLSSLAVYHMVQAIKSGETSTRPGLMFASLLSLTMSWGLVALVVFSKVGGLRL